MTQYKVERKLQEQGGSLLVSLPRIWCDAHGLEDASKVEIAFNGDVRIRPSHEAGGRGMQSRGPRKTKRARPCQEATEPE